MFQSEIFTRRLLFTRLILPVLGAVFLIGAIELAIELHYHPASGKKHLGCCMTRTAVSNSIGSRCMKG